VSAAADHNASAWGTKWGGAGNQHGGNEQTGGDRAQNPGFHGVPPMKYE
jgi:hypothetical protein